MIGHGHVSSYVFHSLRNAFHMSSFQEEIKHKRNGGHICLKIKSGSTYEEFPPTSSLVSMVVNGHTHIHTLEMGCNSSAQACVSVCVQSDGPAPQCFDSLSWNEGVMSLFLWGFRVTGMRSRGVKTTLDSSLFPATPTVLLHNHLNTTRLLHTFLIQKSPLTHVPLTWIGFKTCTV